MSATSSTISADLAVLDAHLASLQEQADGLALAAVDGDQQAGGEIARLLAEIDRVKAERPILERAQAMALRREAHAGHEADAVARAGHMAEASRHADRLLELARGIDAAQATMLPMLSELAATERAIWTSLRMAGASPTGMIVGQRDLAGLAMQRLTLAAQGRTMFASDQRGVEEIAKVAWSDLIMENDND